MLFELFVQTFVGQINYYFRICFFAFLLLLLLLSFGLLFVF